MQQKEELTVAFAKGIILLSVPTYVVLAHFVPAQPWGKTIDSENLSKNPWYIAAFPTLPARWAWFGFEVPNLVWTAVHWSKAGSLPVANTILLSLFVLHYLYRAIIYPLALSHNTKHIPFFVFLAAFVFTNFNGYLQAASVCYSINFPPGWIWHPQFWFGILFFLVGMRINQHSDAILRRLRSQSVSYQIPRGGMFEFVSAPHYLGEIMEWIGFAIANRFSLASVAFVIYTASNLIPRAVAHHHWYRRNFVDDYPPERRAIVPFVL